MAVMLPFLLLVDNLTGTVLVLLQQLRRSFPVRSGGWRHGILGLGLRVSCRSASEAQSMCSSSR